MEINEIIKAGLAMGGTIVCSLGGGVVILSTVLRWYGDILSQKLLVKIEHKYEKEIEKYKAELQNMSSKYEAIVEHSMQVASKQYDMEVEVYRNIWSALHELTLCQNCIEHFENPTEADPSNYLAIKRDMYGDINTKLLNFEKQIDSAAPFYQMEAYNTLCSMDTQYKALLKILGTCVGLQAMSADNIDIVNNKILPQIEILKMNLTNIIREYLFSLKKIPNCNGDDN